MAVYLIECTRLHRLIFAQKNALLKRKAFSLGSTFAPRLMSRGKVEVTVCFTKSPLAWAGPPRLAYSCPHVGSAPALSAVLV